MTTNIIQEHLDKLNFEKCFFVTTPGSDFPGCTTILEVCRTIEAADKFVLENQDDYSTPLIIKEAMISTADINNPFWKPLT